MFKKQGEQKIYQFNPNMSAKVLEKSVSLKVAEHKAVWQCQLVNYKYQLLKINTNIKGLIPDNRHI